MRDWQVMFVLFILSILLLVWIGYSISQVFTENSAQSQIGRHNLFLEARIPPAVIINSEMIACLITRESSGNPKAYNPADPITPSIGLLQFKKTTFQGFCVERYDLPDDIWNEDVQIECCEKMLKEGKGFHWSTYESCK